jgi:hypothetical protein
MRSGANCTITSGEVFADVQKCLLQAKLVKDHGWLCTGALLVGILLRAAGRSISVTAGCRDMAHAPSDQAMLTALEDGLPKTLPVLEQRLNDCLTGPLPSRMRRHAWPVAIDWHLQPYYGQPYKSRNEIYYSKPKQGTKKFHAYASACIVEYGRRYTLALTWVRGRESMIAVLRRLLKHIRKIGLKIRYVLLDRAFFNVPVMQFLQAEKLPFLMPVMFRGRRSKKSRKATGLRAMRQKSAGWYTYTMKNRKQEVTFRICVGYRTQRNRKDGKRVQKKLLFAAWRVKGTPTEIRQRYRLRFGIETSYRQMRQARIYTCTRNPHLRLFFLAVGLILRNIWVWLHQECFAEGSDDNPTMRLELLRFKRMLDWIVYEVVALYHDGSPPCVTWQQLSLT